MTPVATSGGLVTLGETMGMVSAADTGPLEFSRSFDYSVGGAESNVAIGVARLGCPATWIGRLGRDATGDMIERRLLAERVRALVRRDDSFTGLMVKHRRFGAVTSVDYHRTGSAGSRLNTGDIPEGVVEAAGVLHITGITPALSASAHEAVQEAVARARKAGVAVSIDLNYRRKLWSPQEAGPVLRGLVHQADIVFAGVEESLLVLDAEPADRSAAALVHELAALGPRQAVVKDGARGCTALVDDVVHQVPAVPVQVVDPVGAGDAFVAGYLAEFLSGRPADVRLGTAVAAGAFAVGVRGDCEGLPGRTDLEALSATDEVTR